MRERSNRGPRLPLVAGLLGAAALLLPAPAVPAPPPRIDCVDPFIGTQDMGHCYPGATVPFGLVQLSPDTETADYSVDGKTYDPAAYRYCAGYQYGDSTIVGFSHTHFHGTGHADLGDLLIMPQVGPLQLEPGRADRPGSGYRSRFSHASERASPGYYAVRLEDPGVDAELTATSRVGLHRYRFPASHEARILLDLVHGIYNYDGKVIWSSVRVEDDHTVTGWRQTRGWARTRLVHFALEFSKPFKSYGCRMDDAAPYRDFYRKWDQTHDFPDLAGRSLKLWFDFDTAAGERILVKVALSGTGRAGALANLRAEAPGWDFDGARQAAAAAWERELSRFDLDADPARRTVFYTALYHSLLSPVEFMDVDGRYRGLDGDIHVARGWTNHTIFSLWDTFRALHPLFTLIQPARTDDLVNSLLAHAQQSALGLLPVWSHWAQENWCMIGYHAVPVIADAIVKGFHGFDRAAALAAMRHSATYGPYDGLADYLRLGWVPDDRQRYAASKTLEYAYDDWTLARAAERLGRRDLVAEFDARARNDRNLFDPRTGFMRSRLADGSWRPGFDPVRTSDQGYIEGNAWNYSLFAPHDVAWLVRAMGGESAFAAHLDSLFTMTLPPEAIADTEDLSPAGMIGNYVHGNEPSHHVAYLYAWAGVPWKTQERVREIMDRMYRPGPAGLCGNDDCGQMSAWYIFSAMGFYPVCPGSGEYVIGAPLARDLTLRLDRGRTLRIRAPQLDPQNIYIQRVELNGRPWDKTYFRHADLVKGADILFVMGPEPNRAWASAPEARPYALPVD
ncbi:MAG: GH92 family glycosyl hydrolase [Candidatus Krumholzibacteriia bacterium]